MKRLTLSLALALTACGSWAENTVPEPDILMAEPVAEFRYQNWMNWIVTGASGTELVVIHPCSDGPRTKIDGQDLDWLKDGRELQPGYRLILTSTTVHLWDRRGEFARGYPFNRQDCAGDQK